MDDILLFNLRKQLAPLFHRVQYSSVFFVSFDCHLSILHEHFRVDLKNLDHFPYGPMALEALGQREEVVPDPAQGGRCHLVIEVPGSAFSQAQDALSPVVKNASSSESTVVSLGRSILFF